MIDCENEDQDDNDAENDDGMLYDRAGHKCPGTDKDYICTCKGEEYANGNASEDGCDDDDSCNNIESADSTMTVHCTNHFSSLENPSSDV